MTFIDRLSRAHTDLEQMLRVVANGTCDNPRRFRRIDLAVLHLREWQTVQPPPTSQQSRGGSSSPAEVEDRLEESALTRAIIRDSGKLPELLKRIEKDCREAAQIVTRYVETVHPDKLPVPVDPGCKSCIRTMFRGKGTKIGGHWAEVRKDSGQAQLCDWCYRYALSMRKKGMPISPEHYPPIEACDKWHSEGPQAAGLWLARQQRVAS